MPDTQDADPAAPAVPPVAPVPVIRAPRARKPRVHPEEHWLRFSAPKLIGGGPTQKLLVGDRFTVRDSNANNGTFEVTSFDRDWVTVDRAVVDEPPNAHATLTVEEED